VGRIIGIDLGTTNSCVAVMEGADPIVIHNQEGGRTTPSMVAFSESGDVLVGAPAKRQAVTNPKRTVHSAKRLIGRKSGSAEVDRLKKTMPYEIAVAQNGDAWIRVGDRTFAPEEVSAHVLEKMRTVAEDYLGEAVSEAIVTVPAYFDDVQRQATKDAGLLAGLTVRSILNEPTAAALAYGLHQDKDGVYAVFDLGGGTFDISILRAQDGVFEVLATNGDTTLGGDDFDLMLVHKLVTEFKAAESLDLTGDPVALQRLRDAAERAKHELSSALNTDINLPFVAVGAGGPKHLIRELSRSELEALVAPLLGRLEAPCRRALSDARLTEADITSVVLVGGMTRMPAVQAKVEEVFKRKPSRGVNPDEIVAMGAAIQSGMMDGEGAMAEMVLLDVTPHALGIRAAGGRFAPIIPAQTTIPTRETKVFATTEDNQELVTLEVYQGGAPDVKDNRHLGTFTLGNLPRGPRGSLRVEVAFTVDADGIVSVDAKELTSGKATSIRIDGGSGLSKNQLDEMAEKRTGQFPKLIRR